MAIQDRGSQPLQPPLEAKLERTFQSFDIFVDEFRARTSLGGMFVATPKPRPVGTEIRFKLTLDDGYRLLRGIGEVAWVRPKAHDEDPAGMGIRFLALDEGSRTLVLKMLEEQVKAGGQPFEIDKMPPGAHDESPDHGQQLTLGDLAEAPPAAGADGDATRLVVPGAGDGVGFDAPWGEHLPELPNELVDEEGAPIDSPPVVAGDTAIALGPPAVDPDLADPELDETDFGFTPSTDRDTAVSGPSFADVTAVDEDEEPTVITRRAEVPTQAVEPAAPPVLSVDGRTSVKAGEADRPPIAYPDAFGSEDPTLVSAGPVDTPYAPEGGFELAPVVDDGSDGGEAADPFAVDEYGVDELGVDSLGANSLEVDSLGGEEFGEDSEISFAQRDQPSSLVVPPVATPAAEGLEPPSSPDTAPPAVDLAPGGVVDPSLDDLAAPPPLAASPFDTAAMEQTDAATETAPVATPTPMAPAAPSAPSAPAAPPPDLFDTPAAAADEAGETPRRGVFAGGWSDDEPVAEPSANLAPAMPVESVATETEYDYDDLESPKRGVRGSLGLLAALVLVVALLAAGFVFRDTLAGLIGLGGDAPVVASGGPPPAGSPSAPGPSASEPSASGQAPAPADGASAALAGGADPTEGLAAEEGLAEDSPAQGGPSGSPQTPADQAASAAAVLDVPEPIEVGVPADDASERRAQTAVPPPPRPRATPPAAPARAASTRGARATSIRGITWNTVTGGTRVVLDLDGDLPASQIEHDIAAWAPDREILKLRGLSGFERDAVRVGSAELSAIRVGLHAGPEVHVVFDFAGAGMRVAELKDEGSRIQLLITGP